MPWWLWSLVIIGGLFIYLSIGCGLYILTSNLLKQNWRYDFRYSSGFVVACFFFWPLVEPIILISSLGEIIKYILDRIASIGEVSGRRKE